MEPEVLETEQTPVKKDHSLLIIILVGLLFIAITSVISYKTGLSKKDSNETPAKPTATNKVEDEAILKKVNEKLLILRINDIDLFYETFQGKVFELDSYKFKERIILNYLFGDEYETKTDAIANHPGFYEKMEAGAYNYYGNVDPFRYITKEEFFSYYKKLFGTDPTKVEFDDIIYFPEEEIYVDSLQQPKGRSNKEFPREEKYVYLVEEDNNNYYVYFSYVEICNYYKMYKNYYDAYNNNPFIDCDDKDTCPEADNFKITEDNYQEFQKLKVTFKKEADDFYLKSIERIED